MRKIYVLSFLLVSFFGISVPAFAQPTVLGSSVVTGTYSTTNLNTVGGFKQIRLQATSSGVAGARSWEFAQGTAGSTDYSTNWRPYSGSCNGNANVTISGYNNFIAPSATYPATTATATKNTTSGGCSGYLPAVTSGNYYTFNVTNLNADNNMSVLETNFAPVTISSVSQTPATVVPNNSVQVNIITSATPSAGENVFVRYTTNGYTSSTLVQASFNGTTGTAVIPCQAAASVVSYYVFSSNKSLTTINSDVATFGQTAYDMATLNLNNNGGSNYGYTVAAASTNFSGVYSVPSTCYTTLASFITALNAGTITGPVTCIVASGYTETAPAGGYSITATGTATNTIKFMKPGGGVNPVFTAPVQTVGNINDAVFKIIGGDYITIDGFTMLEGTGSVNTPAASNNMTEFGVALFYASTTNGAQNNTIQNCTITLNRVYLNTIGIYSNTRTTATATTTLAEATTAGGSNSGNKIYGNAISNVNYGVVFIGAGTTIAAIDNGNDIGGTSASTGNTITNWGGGASLSSYTSLTGNNYCIFVNQQINNNVSYNTITSASLTQSVTTGGILQNYSVASPTSGTITSVINNNTVTVTNNPTAATTGQIIAINNQGLTPLLATATMSMNNNSVQNCVLGGSTSTTNGFTAITNLSLPGTMNMNGNNVINNTITATTATSAQLAGITNSGAAGTLNMNNNILRGFASTSTSGAFFGMQNSGAVTTAINMTGNQFGNASGNLITTSAATSGAINVLTNTAGAAAALLTITGNDIRGIVHTAAASSAHTYIANSTFTGSTNISTNTFTNLNVNTTGGVTFIGNNVSHAASTTQNVNSNSIVTAYIKGGSGGTVYFYNSYGSSGNTVTEINTNNNFSNLTFTGAAIAGWRSADGTTPGSRKTVTSNIFNNITNNGATGTITSILYVGFGDNTYASNNVSLNTITNITAAGTVVGFFSDGQNQNFFNNVISGITTTGTQVLPISYAGAGIQNCYNNSICNIEANNATGSVYGIYITAGTTFNIYNNRIGDLRTPISSATTISVAGLASTSTTTSSNINFYFNTINLNATSSGTNFTTEGIFHTVSTTATTAALDMRNNIIVNTSTPNGSGLAIAFGRSAGTAGTLANYASTSNKNLFYAGTPSASRLIYYDGTAAAQTLAAYKGGVFTAGTVAPRDAASISESPNFLSTTCGNANFLKINTAIATQIESGGSPISGINTDFEGDTRNVSTPDIGADEFNGITPAPAFANVTVPTGTCSATAHVINADVTTATGTITSVVLNYNNGAAGSVTMTFVSGNTYTGTIPAASPANSTVTFSITATNSLGLTSTFTGTPYTDAPTAGISVTASANPTTICAGSSSVLTATTASTAAASYTAPPAVTNPTSDEDFANITITQGATTILNNTSANNSLTGTIGVASGTVGSYSNFTGFGPYAVTAGQTYNFSVASSTSGTAYSNALAIYIDYNRNGVFTDAGEQVYTSAATTSGAHTETGSFSVPATAFNGLTRMRVISNEGLITSSTQSVSYGEYEEYLLNVSSANNGGGAAVTVAAYSWSNGATVVGTTNPLTVTPMVTTSYTVTATVASCPVVSAPVTVTVNPTPTAPTGANSSQCGNGVPTASVADPNGFTTPVFKWYSAATGGTLLQSSTSTTYTASINTTTTFYVSVTNPVTGCESARTAVMVTVTQPDSLTASASQTSNVCANSSIQLSVAQTGNANSYTLIWTASPAAGSGIPTSAPGSLATPLTVTPTAAGNYVYTITGTDGICTTFSNVSVTVIDPFAGTTLTASASPTNICQGASSILTAVLTGPNTGTPGTSAGAAGTGAAAFTNGRAFYGTYWGNARQQWLIKANELTAAGFSAGNITSLSIAVTAVGSPASLTSFTIKMGNSTATTLTNVFSAAATTTVWGPSNFSPVVGTNTHTFVTPFNWDGISNVVIEVCHNNQVTGSTNFANAYSAPGFSCGLNFGVDGATSTVCSSTATSNTSLTSRPLFSFTGTGALTPSSYSWSDGTSQVGTTNLLSVSPTLTTTYTVTAGFGGCTKSSAGVIVTVNPATVITSQPTDATYCQGVTPTVLMVSATGQGTLIYQWYSNTINSNTSGTAISGAMSASYTPPTTTMGTIYYYVTVTGGCGAAKSNAVAVVINANTWNGGSGDWFTAANWSCGTVPTAGQDVIIPASMANYPVISTGTATTHNITIASGASVTVNAAGVFGLYGAVTNAGSFDLTDGTLNLAGAGVSVSGSSIAASTVKNLTISNGGSSSITAGAGNNLNVSQYLSFASSGNTFTTNGNITLLSRVISSVDHTASITDITNNGTNTGNSVVGNASVERYISVLPSRKWRYIAINTEAIAGSKTTIQNNWMEGQAPGTFTSTGYGMQITDPAYTASPANYDAFSYTPNMKWWNGSVYIGVTDPTTTSIRDHSAYFTYVRGDRSSGAATASTNTILRTFGGLAQGTKSVSIPSGSAYVGLGNPYASAIDLRKVDFTGNGSAAVNIYVWDPRLSLGSDLGAFQKVTRDPSGSYFYIFPGGGSYPNTPNGNGDIVMNTIESGLGMFVQGGASTVSLDFKEVAKTQEENSAANFTPGAQQSVLGKLYIRESATVNTLMDGLQVKMHSTYNTALDPSDARKLQNTQENISVLRENTLLSLEYRNWAMPVNDTIFLNFANTRIKNYRWNFTIYNMDLPGRTGVLIDKYNNTETTLDLTGSNDYDFNVVNIAGSYAADRFMIVFRQAAVVPVRFTSITATRQADGSNLVKWNTATELNVTRYEVERSADGQSFTSLGLNTAPTNNNGGGAAYHQTDATPLKSDNYYRIKVLDDNGHISHSAVAKVGALANEGVIAVIPNPVTGKTIHVYASGVAGNYAVQVLNAKGQSVYSGNISFTAGENRKEIALNGATAQGQYNLVMVNEKGEKKVIKMVVLE